MPPDQMREIAALNTLQYDKKHPNIVEFHGLVHDEKREQVYLVLELCPTTLAEVIDTVYKEHEEKNESAGVGFGIGERETMSITCDIAAGLEHCHTLNLMHRDLKPQNVLLTKDRRAKLCDFGMTCGVSFGLAHSPQMITRWYRAPEVLLGSKYYGTAVDVWSLGCIVFEMCWLRVPFIGKSEMQMLELVFDAFGVPSAVHDSLVHFEYNPRPSLVPNRIAQCGALGAVLGKMLKLEPRARPTAKGVLATVTGLLTDVPTVGRKQESPERHALDTPTGTTSADAATTSTKRKCDCLAVD